ncbi:PREDICTED: uncharacterized protein LOC104824254 isoform X2 [Tarenaya hassleriana]|uniref:uncharacterized protein LOC104824254 isoform X2 n=1 Tax=Tarenaya hassleriana TaxID=28532 RepID=UPI00053C1E43|nr:PREDICTED: uncharacterized protein LOC104824254 isoform X2 [Tarenaya hassleriana]
MESERIRSSVIARLVGFDELQQPQQNLAKKQRFLSDNYQPKVAMIGTWGKKYISKQDQEKQIKGFVSMGNEESSSGFLVSPTKEMCRAYLQKPTLFASTHVIDAQATPPHKREKSTKLTGSSIRREMVGRLNFGMRAGQQSLESNLKPKHHNWVNPVKPKIRKKESSLRCFSPITAPRASHLGDRKMEKSLLLENKAKERKKLFDGTLARGGKEKYSGEIVSNSMVSTYKDLVGSDTLDADVKLRLTSSPHFTSKDEEGNPLHCSGTYPECQTSLEEGNQPSPVSVLEPVFDGEMLENFEKLPHFNFLGLEQQLEILKSESVESYSEGSGMVVSSDDESDEESILDSGVKEDKDTKPIGSLGVQENHNSSYTDDVFAEAGFENGKFFNRWDSVDLPINPKIFERLEKKYTHHTSWRKSDRILWLDRVNSGLKEILESYIAAPRWKKSVSRRLRTVLTTQGLKEELQKLLEMQDKRAKKESSDKMAAIDIDEWLELEADVEPVVRELETMLVDELLDELVGIVCRV